jgi:transcriptional regulator with XRE-family HTH domain
LRPPGLFPINGATTVLFWYLVLRYLYANGGALKLDRRKLIRARELLGYGIEKTAQEAKVSKNSVLRAEHGEDIRPVTARKIAGALDVPVADLLEGGWQQAFDNSRYFRTHAEERLRERLWLWEAARDERAGDEERRRLLDEVGLVLDEANEVLRRLQENLGEGLGGMKGPGEENPYWEEVREADTSYRELLAMVGDAGLSVRPAKTSNAARLRQHKLEALAG